MSFLSGGDLGAYFRHELVPHPATAFDNNLSFDPQRDEYMSGYGTFVTVSYDREFLADQGERRISVDAYNMLEAANIARRLGHLIGQRNNRPIEQLRRGPDGLYDHERSISGWLDIARAGAVRGWAAGAERFVGRRGKVSFDDGTYVQFSPVGGRGIRDVRAQPSSRVHMDYVLPKQGTIDNESPHVVEDTKAWYRTFESALRMHLGTEDPSRLWFTRGTRAKEDGVNSATMVETLGKLADDATFSEPGWEPRYTQGLGSMLRRRGNPVRELFLGGLEYLSATLRVRGKDEWSVSMDISSQDPLILQRNGGRQRDWVHFSGTPSSTDMNWEVSGSIMGRKFDSRDEGDLEFLLRSTFRGRQIVRVVDGSPSGSGPGSTSGPGGGTPSEAGGGGGARVLPFERPSGSGSSMAALHERVVRGFTQAGGARVVHGAAESLGQIAVDGGPAHNDGIFAGAAGQLASAAGWLMGAGALPATAGM